MALALGKLSMSAMLLIYVTTTDVARNSVVSIEVYVVSLVIQQKVDSNHGQLSVSIAKTKLHVSPGFNA